MIVQWDTAHVVAYVFVYAILCGVAAWLTLTADREFDEGEKETGYVFMYGPGAALAALIPFLLLVWLYEAMTFTEWWLGLWFLIEFILAIIFLMAALPLIVIVLPLWAVFEILFGWSASLILAVGIFGLWSVVSLAAVMDRWGIEWLEDRGVLGWYR
jgi:hypothetical protein